MHRIGAAHAPHTRATRTRRTHVPHARAAQALLAALPASTGRAIHRSVMRLAPLHLDVSEQLQAAADQQECELCIRASRKELCTAVGRRATPLTASAAALATAPVTTPTPAPVAAPAAAPAPAPRALRSSAS